VRVAIASSGLRCISRGVEAWAFDLAAASRRAGIDVTLFQAGSELLVRFPVPLPRLAFSVPVAEKIRTMYRDVSEARRAARPVVKGHAA
jgi:hypothetical protein